MSYNWNEMEVFCSVAEHGSFTRAAERLDWPKSRVSRAISNLEQKLGTRLLERSTRRLRLTDAGRQLHDQLWPLFGRLHDVVEATLSQHDQPQGTLRISAPFEFGVLQLNQVICALLARHTGLEVEIELTTQQHHPIASDFDIVFGIYQEDPDDSALIARRVLTLDTVLCAAPSLIARYGLPTHPTALSGWPCLLRSDERSWHFTSAREAVEVPVTGRLHANNASLHLGAAEAGIGVAIISRILCEEALEAGRLIPLLPEYRTKPRLVYAFMPSRKLPPARVKAMLEAFESAMRPLQPPRISPLRNRP